VICADFNLADVIDKPQPTRDVPKHFTKDMLDGYTWRGPDETTTMYDKSGEHVIYFHAPGAIKGRGLVSSFSD
jgi:hypothetical protein